MNESALYKVGDEAVFTLNGIQREGIVFIVDANGTFSLSQMSRVKLASTLPWRENEGYNPTFERPKVPSYDILVESENMLYKHVPYDMVCKKQHS